MFDLLTLHITKNCDPVACAYCKKRRRIEDEEAGKPPLDPECTSCPEGMPENECPASRRQCGHHCNCSWVHDHCHWCDAEFSEEEASPAGVDTDFTNGVTCDWCGKVPEEHGNSDAGPMTVCPPPCSGAYGCGAETHVHGCYADRGACDSPAEHAALPGAVVMQEGAN
jgi:hypothetical protein